MKGYVIDLAAVKHSDIQIVGGKNASLGEMLHHLQNKGIAVPGGFATTADAYWDFITSHQLGDWIAGEIEKWRRGRQPLEKAGSKIRQSILKASLSLEFKEAILKSYRAMGAPVVAVRSSATAEDLPSASFAGQLESYLNVKGEQRLLEACKQCMASLFTNRAIMYREEKGFGQLDVGLSVGVQKMVRSDKGSSGVMFTLDTETGCPKVILINAIWGLGELIVKGVADPDEYVVYKPLAGVRGRIPIIEMKTGAKQKKLVCRGLKTERISCTEKERGAHVLKEDEILQLAAWGKLIEEHYGVPMDIEWAKDGISGELFIVQARPETVHSLKAAQSTLETYSIQKKGTVLLEGLSVGRKIASGKVCKLKSPAQIHQFPDGAILVTSMTDPDWVPIMKKASGIITDHGGRTSHAAIVSRELGLPAIVGTSEGTRVLKGGQKVTLSCAEGSRGFVYDGLLPFKAARTDLKDLAPTKVDLMLNLGEPDAAMSWWKLPCKGVGLARMEFIISNHIQIHPMALVHWKQLKDPKAKIEIARLTQGCKNKTEYFVEKLSSGIAKIAAVYAPHPVIVRLSDFKTNEYAQLIGGYEFEPKEENPMLGWRGASRYYHPGYSKGFALECLAIKRAREKIGLENIIVMIPFCRTPEEAGKVMQIMARHGLKRGVKGLKVYVMCEIPSNVILAQQFAELVDGFSIGSNDLTQLVLGVDRDSEQIADLFEEQNEAVKWMIQEVIQKSHQNKCKVGICGQAPSDHPEFAQFLTQAGIDSISVTPDSFLMVHKNVELAERREKGILKKNKI